MIDENIDILLMKLWSSQPILFSHKFKVDGSQSIEKRLIILSFVSITSPDCQCITSQQHQYNSFWIHTLDLKYWFESLKSQIEKYREKELNCPLVNRLDWLDRLNWIASCYVELEFVISPCQAMWEFTISPCCDMLQF